MRYRTNNRTLHFLHIKNLKQDSYSHGYFCNNVDANSTGFIGDINDDNRIITEYSDILKILKYLYALYIIQIIYK